MFAVEGLPTYCSPQLVRPAQSRTQLLVQILVLLELLQFADERVVLHLRAQVPGLQGHHVTDYQLSDNQLSVES